MGRPTGLERDNSDHNRGLYQLSYGRHTRIHYKQKSPALKVAERHFFVKRRMGVDSFTDVHPKPKLAKLSSA